MKILVPCMGINVNLKKVGHNSYLKISSDKFDKVGDLEII